jgi:ABC-type transport system involved in cytochrome bd biosynthesis fused ATPase/permease subunit
VVIPAILALLMLISAVQNLFNVRLAPTLIELVIAPRFLAMMRALTRQCAKNTRGDTSVNCQAMRLVVKMSEPRPGNLLGSTNNINDHTVRIQEAWNDNDYSSEDMLQRVNE